MIKRIIFLFCHLLWGNFIHSASISKFNDLSVHTQIPSNGFDLLEEKTQIQNQLKEMEQFDDTKFHINKPITSSHPMVNDGSKAMKPRSTKSTQPGKEQWAALYRSNEMERFDLETKDQLGMNSRQHWSYDFLPGGKRDPLDASTEEKLRGFLMESYTDEKTFQNPESRQHWSNLFMPGGKRDIVFPSSLSLDKRQHWSPGLAPGGKRSYSFSNSIDKRNPGMHPGDKSSFPSSNLVNKRQHWSRCMNPGGKRSVQSSHSADKRQHWSPGMYPGGKRSVDVSQFSPRHKRSGGMSEIISPVVQPKPKSYSLIDDMCNNIRS